jgi:mRNA interferase MazF
MGGLLHSVICAPVTSTVRGLTTEIALGAAEGLASPSVVNFDNTFLLSRSLLIQRLGRASRQKMDEACEALAIAAGCKF